MCGIVGYIGKKDAYPILIKGLKRLEYRGYDSAGVALINKDGELNVYKARGKVADLENFCSDKDISGTIGLAHTRWATHGEPSQRNAHPHFSSSHRLAIIHNGIIENYAVLKRKLEEYGVTFSSDTDSEVLVQLVEYIMTKKSCDLLTAVQVALHQVIGAYAIAILDKSNPDQIIAARKQSPLVVGIGRDEFFLGSDATPIVEYTDKVVYLEDGNIAVIRRNRDLDVVSILNHRLAPEIQTVDLKLGQIEKGGYEHFMLKEIFEQPECFENCIRGHVSSSHPGNVYLRAVQDHTKEIEEAKRFIIVACGTSWHAGLIGKQLIEDLCRVPVDVEYASEFRYGSPFITKDDVVIAISQSGETADTLAAIQLARSKGAFVYGICNVVGASIPRNTDSGTYIHVGPEIGVASTKAFTGQVTVLTLLALCVGQMRGTVDEATVERIARELKSMPIYIKEVLRLDDQIKNLSKIYTYARNFLYLGRGYNYPTALEGALKLKEISYIHAEGYPAAEMKHGPIALVDSEMPTVVIAPNDSLYDKIISNVRQVKARGGTVVAIITKGNDAMKELADHCLEVSDVPECLTPLVVSVPLQLLAYYIAINKDRNVDQPRNLAKSVTVE